MDRTILHRFTSINYLELVRRSVYMDNRGEFVHVHLHGTKMNHEDGYGIHIEGKSQSKVSC